MKYYVMMERDKEKAVWTAEDGPFDLDKAKREAKLRNAFDESERKGFFGSRFWTVIEHIAENLDPKGVAALKANPKTVPTFDMLKSNRKLRVRTPEGVCFTISLWNWHDCFFGIKVYPDKKRKRGEHKGPYETEHRAMSRNAIEAWLEDLWLVQDGTDLTNKQKVVGQSTEEC